MPATLLDSVAANGAGRSVEVGEVMAKLSRSRTAPERFTVWVIYETAAPTSATIKLEGSPDGTNWATGDPLGATSDVSAATVDFHVANKPSSFLRANLSNYVAGSCTGVTVICLGA